MTAGRLSQQAFGLQSSCGQEEPTQIPYVVAVSLVILKEAVLQSCYYFKMLGLHSVLGLEGEFGQPSSQKNFHGELPFYRM